MTHGGYTHREKSPTSTEKPIMKKSKITKLLKETADKANSESLDKWGREVIDCCHDEAKRGGYKLVVYKLSGRIDTLSKNRCSKLKELGLDADFEDTKSGIALVVKW